MPTDIALGRFTAGVDVAGSPSGYSPGGELRFSTATVNAGAALTTSATGTPTFFFDHRGSSNTGNWYWRNGANVNRMWLDAVGGLHVTGGVDVVGSPTGFTGGEIKFSTTGANAEQGIATFATGAPTMEFDHRGTGNTGAWVWRNGTDGSSQRMVLTSSGNFHAMGSDHYLGANAFGSTGSAAWISAGADANVYFIAQSSYADAHTIIRSKGTGLVKIQSSAGTDMATFALYDFGGATALTLHCPYVGWRQVLLGAPDTAQAGYRHLMIAN